MLMSDHRANGAKTVIEPLDRRLMFVDVSASWGYVGRTYVAGEELTGVFTVTTHSKEGVPAGSALGVSLRLSTDKVWGNSDDVLLLTLDFFGGLAGRTTTTFIEDPGSPGDLIKAASDDDPRLRVTIPANTSAGNYYVAIFADDTNEFAEDNESNNLKFSDAPNVKLLDSDGILRIAGTSGDDRITVAGGGEITATVNGLSQTYDLFRVNGIEIQAGDGDDIVTLLDRAPGTYVNGGAGNDKITGSTGNDTLTGGAGKDQVFAGSGNDRLNGGASGDKLYGEGGNDRIFGDGGNDTVDGGSGDDQLLGGRGRDVISGQSGDDDILANDSEADQVFGGTGNDTASIDDDDVLSSIEGDDSGGSTV